MKVIYYMLVSTSPTCPGQSMTCGWVHLVRRLPFWQDEDDMRDSSMTAVRSAVAEPIPLDYGPWLNTSPACRDFVTRLLQCDPQQRLTAEDAVHHPWFAQHGISDVCDGCFAGSSPAEDAAAGAAAANAAHAANAAAADGANNVVPGPVGGRLQRSNSESDMAIF